jgi:hypothetical protein
MYREFVLRILTKKVIWSHLMHEALKNEHPIQNEKHPVPLREQGDTSHIMV